MLYTTSIIRTPYTIGVNMYPFILSRRNVLSRVDKVVCSMGHWAGSNRRPKQRCLDAVLLVVVVHHVPGLALASSLKSMAP